MAADTVTPARRLGLVLAAMFTLAATNAVIFPLLPSLQDAYGLPTWSLGVLSGTAFLVGLVVQLTVAGFADRGHAARLLRVGLAASVVGGLLFALGSTLPVFVIARGISGFAVGCFVPAARAVAATIDPARVAANLGLLASFELGGFVFGPVVGSFLVGPLGVRWPFAIFAAAAAVALVVSFFLPLPSYGSTGTSSRPSLDLLRYRGVLVAAVLALAMFLPVGVYDALWGRYLEDRGASTLFVGFSMAAYGIPFVLLAPKGGRFADRRGPLRAALLTIVLIAPMTAGYGLLRMPLAIALLALVEASVQAIAVPAVQATMAQACPPERTAAGQGLAGATQLAGAGCVAFLAAPMYERFGPEVVFGAAGLAVGVLGFVAHRLSTSGARDVEAVPAQP